MTLSPHINLINRITFILLAAVSVSGIISAPIALGLGFLLALTIKNPYPAQSRKYSKYLLQWSVVGLGFGMNAYAVINAGLSGFWFAAATVFGTLLIGLLLGRLLKVPDDTSALISSGTGICGGSAIAAVAPVINADAKSISVSLGIVFLLNSIALFIFPVAGHFLHLTQNQFGMWAAIAIHDTSSVVGASSVYGEEALKIATTVKLTRALWIVPVALGFSLLRKRKESKISIPWFIGFFILATIITTILPDFRDFYVWIKTLALHGLTLTLFLIGSALSRKDLKEIGFRPMIQAVLLWIGISMVSLFVILSLIH